MNIRQFYAGQNIFLSGTTGFVGKVVLEKIIRSLPDFGKIFVMVRPKKGVPIEDRLRDIFASEIFTRVLKVMGQANFKQMIRDRIVPVAGDLTKDNLGMSVEDRQMLVQELDIIINCAASVNFDDPLLDALQINYFGCLRVLQLAKECHKLKTLTHVSTAYVNSDRRGFIEEKIYKLKGNEDPEQAVQNILKMSPEQVQKQEKQLIGSYPNTYTFTKSLAERTLEKLHGDVKLSIVRPSIINSCIDEPLIGWTDTLAAAGGVTISLCLGLMHYVRAESNSILDMVPCDYVCNAILVTTAHTGQQPLGALNIFHSATSHTKPLKLIEYVREVENYVQKYPFFKQAFEPYFRPVPNEQMHHMLLFLTEELPARFMLFYSRLPFVGSQDLQEQAEMYNRIRIKMFNIQSLFFYFMNNEWVYEQRLVNTLLENMSAEEKSEFRIDNRLIDWAHATQGFCYGIRRFYAKEDIVSPDTGYKQLLSKNLTGYFHDLRVASAENPSLMEKDTQVYFNSILSRERFQNYAQLRFPQHQQQKQQTQKNQLKSSEDLTSESAQKLKQAVATQTNKNTLEYDHEAAKKQLLEMHTKISKIAVKSIVWYFNKTMRHALTGLHVDHNGIERVQKMVNGPSRVVFMPVYKSYTDFFIHTYVNNHYQMQVPFTFGNFEDTPRINLIDKWIKNSGYIMMRRGEKQSLQSHYVNQALLKEVIEHNKVTTLFQNADRLRSGKFHTRQSSDLSVKWLLEAYHDLARLKQDFYIVPIMVSYDRLFEASFLARDMVSGEQKDPSFFSTLKTLHTTKKNQFGQVYVRHLEPIHLQDYLDKHGFQKLDGSNINEAALRLSGDLLRIQTMQTPITLNSILAASLLQEKSSSIKMASLIRKSTILCEYVRSKENSTTYMQVKPQAALVEQHVQNLGFQLKNAGKKDCKILLDDKDQNLTTMLGLAHYSLSLSSVLILEGCVSTVVKSQQGNSKQISKVPNADECVDKSVKLVSIFKYENMQVGENDTEKIKQRLSYFVQTGVLENQDGEIKIAKIDHANLMLDFFSQIMRSYIDTYYVVLVALEQMCGRQMILKVKKMVQELHQAIKMLYADGVVPDLHSCLKEIVNTAIDRFASLKLLELRSYSSRKHGAQSEFMSCPAECRENIEKTMAFLQEFRKFTPEEIRNIGFRVSAVFEGTQGPLIEARL